MMKHTILLTLALVLLVGLVPMNGAAAQDDLPELTLFMGFIPNIQFAPVYVALAKGYFAEEAGVQVRLEYGDENIGIERIAAGELDFGLMSGEQVILARAGGRPLVYVFEWYQQYPVALATPATTGIMTVADLAGQTVGVPGRFGASYIGLRGLLAANGMSETDIQLEEIGYNAAPLLCTGRVSAAVVYAANEPVQIREQCGDVTVITISDQVDLVANGLITNETSVAENPDLVAGMTRALALGLADVLADPDEALRISRQYVETLPAGGSYQSITLTAAAVADVLAEAAANDGLSAAEAAELAALLAAPLNPDEVIQMQVLANSMALWDAPRLGETDPASWETTMTVLVEAGFLPEPLDLTGAYTNEFLP